jgi:hypothetical protein
VYCFDMYCILFCCTHSRVYSQAFGGTTRTSLRARSTDWCSGSQCCSPRAAQ